METVSDREQIPKLDEKVLITLDETRLSTIGTRVLAVFGVIAAGLLAFVGLGTEEIAKEDQGLVLLAAAFVVATCMIAWAIVAAADIRARGTATAANLALRARADVTVAAPGAAGTSAGLWAHIKGRESTDEHFVVDSRVRRVGDEDERLYLLARADETPTWYSEAEIDSWEVKTSADETS